MVENSGAAASTGKNATIFQSTGEITFTSTGTITGAEGNTAIAAASGTVTNKGTITAGASTATANSFGVNITGKGLIINDGTITAGGLKAAIAIGAGDKTEIVNNGKLVLEGDLSGAILGTGAIKVTNNGSIVVAGDNAFGIRSPGGLDVLNKGAIEVSGIDARGILVDGVNAIVNSGAIDAPKGAGIGATAGLVLTNSGRISGLTGVLVAPGAGPATIVNNGTIIGTGGVSISLTGATDTLTFGPGSRLAGIVNLGGGGDTVSVVLAPRRSQIIMFDDLTGANLSVTGRPFRIIGNAIVALDTTPLRMRDAGIADVRSSIGEILDGRVTKQVYNGDPTKVFYIRPFGGASSYGSTDLSGKFNGRHFGFIAGLDGRPNDKLIIGAFGGGAWSNASTSGPSGPRSSVTHGIGGMYGRATVKFVFADVSVVAGYTNSTGRMIVSSNLTTSGEEIINLNSTGYFFSPEGGIGLNVPVTPELTVSPAVRYRYISGNWAKRSVQSTTGLGIKINPPRRSQIRAQMQASHLARLPGAIFKTYATVGYFTESVSGGDFQLAFAGTALMTISSSKKRIQGFYGNMGLEWLDESGAINFGSVHTDLRTDKIWRISGRGGVRFNF